MSSRKSRSPPPQGTPSRPIDGSFPSSASSVVSTTSSYRHHFASLQIQTTPEPPKRVLMEDASHSPKTRGCVGIMVVGLGGANGTTLLGGVLANRHSLTWRGPKGEFRSANYNGCLTQTPPYNEKLKGLAQVSMAAVGGWDVTCSKLGNALLEHQVLDYDLARQVQEEMNKTRVFKGYYDERFSSHHSANNTATHVLQEKEASEALKYLRADIRYFKWRNGVVGHTTVIWSASTEFDCELPYTTARELLHAIEQTEQERGRPLPPSILYATAALLEGCSFVNGGSQNTLSCKALMDLAKQQLGVYCLGSDFDAGQGTFTSATVDYLRTMGLTPKVNTSNSNNKTSREQQNVMEYTSFGFMEQELSMVTYTRASDTILCVPLMIDAAVWCDFFASRSWPYEKVARALSYLFKLSEGAAASAIGDSSLHKQMDILEAQAQAASDSTAKKKGGSSAKRRVRIRPEEKTTEWAIPHDASIICAGLACVDMQLNQATGGDGGEGIETFEGEKSIGGGRYVDRLTAAFGPSTLNVLLIDPVAISSVSMACKTLARLCHGAALDDDFMQVTPPVVNSVVPLCKIGNDDTGNKLLSLLEACGSASRNVETKYIRNARNKDSSGRTALAVLPIYKDGRRGCFFDAASNDTFSPLEMLEMINSLSSGSNAPDLDRSELSFEDVEQYQEELDALNPDYGAFLFGYPHLLPQMQGDGLVSIFQEARFHMMDGGIVALDLNGVPEASFRTSGGLRTVSDLKNDPVIGPALPHVDILHMNEDELMLLTGCEIEGTDASELEDEYIIARAVNLFLLCGVAVVAVTRGKRGSFVSCNDEERFSRSKMLYV